MPRVQVLQQSQQLPPKKIACALLITSAVTIGLITAPLFTYIGCCTATAAAALYLQERKITRLLATTLSFTMLTVMAENLLPQATLTMAALAALSGAVTFIYTGDISLNRVDP